MRNVSEQATRDERVSRRPAANGEGSHVRERWCKLLIRNIRFLLLGLLIAAAAPGPARSLAQGGINREYDIKAAYLYNFGRYIRWPSGAFGGPAEPLLIGVLGIDPFRSSLDVIAAKKEVLGRKIVVRRFASLDQCGPCHILFVPRTTDPREQVAAITRFQKSPVVLVGETPKFAQRGGVINFYVAQNKIRFEINQDAAKRKQLQISAKLLSLARLVQEESGQ